jgi:hypothetical protein
MIIELKIAFLKFLGAKTFTAKNGDEYIAIPVKANNIYVGEKGYYSQLSLLEYKDGTDQYQNDGFAAVDLGKERREAGEKGPIVGNWKVNKRTAPKSPPQPTKRPAAAAADDDAIPF